MSRRYRTMIRESKGHEVISPESLLINAAQQLLERFGITVGQDPQGMWCADNVKMEERLGGPSQYQEFAMVAAMRSINPPSPTQLEPRLGSELNDDS